MNLKMLTSVLHRANACPPANYHEEFYAVKQLILETWGTRCHTIVQRIQKVCWGDWDYGCGDDCGRCGGTGIYETKYFELEEWVLCGRTFHRPIRRIYGYDGTVGFEGRKTAKRTKGSIDCWRALAILFRGDFLVRNDSLETCLKFRKAVRIASAIGPVPKSLATKLWTIKEEVPF